MTFFLSCFKVVYLGVPFSFLKWFLPYIDMNKPWIYMCSPSRSPLPPPSPSLHSGSSQCISPVHWNDLECMLKMHISRFPLSILEQECLEQVGCGYLHITSYSIVPNANESMRPLLSARLPNSGLLHNCTSDIWPYFAGISRNNQLIYHCIHCKNAEKEFCVILNHLQ